MYNGLQQSSRMQPLFSRSGKIWTHGSVYGVPVIGGPRPTLMWLRAPARLSLACNLRLNKFSHLLRFRFRRFHSFPSVTIRVGRRICYRSAFAKHLPTSKHGRARKAIYVFLTLNDSTGSLLPAPVTMSPLTF